MNRPMKWHIWETDEKVNPLCWDDTVLEFDSEEAAKRFLESVIKANEREDMSFDSTVIAESILYWDGGYLNATKFEVVWDGEKCEAILVDVKD